MNTIMPMPIIIPSGGGNFNGTDLDAVLIILITLISLIQIFYWIIIVSEFMTFDELSSKAFLLRLIPLFWVIFIYSALSKKLKERWE